MIKLKHQRSKDLTYLVQHCTPRAYGCARTQSGCSILCSLVIKEYLPWRLDELSYSSCTLYLDNGMLLTISNSFSLFSKSSGGHTKMQRYGPDPHSFYLFDKCLLNLVASRQGTLLGVGSTGVSSHGFGPHIDFIWEERSCGGRGGGLKTWR